MANELMDNYMETLAGYIYDDDRMVNNIWTMDNITYKLHEIKLKNNKHLLQFKFYDFTESYVCFVFSYLKVHNINVLSSCYVNYSYLKFKNWFNVT